MIRVHHLLTGLGALLLASGAFGQSVKVENAWARATVPGQKTGGVYVDLTSPADSALVAAASPVAARGELHSMSMDAGVMRMRSLPRIELPAGKTVKLAPGGLHVMLVDLKQPLKAGDKIPVTLSLQGPGAAPTTLKLEVPVRAADAPAEHGHKH
ncbi:MAG TPA: copper chaperone PCu(A)C [Burkholderiales bacterium]|nr:copper chaperone PCu(A)C [Burkholderiales bacterium]